MLDLRTVVVVMLGYMVLLFGVAWLAERMREQGKSLITNPVVYTLSIAVYCTSWTYYGSVGLAARSGYLFLAVYLGPTLVAFSWWMLLRRMVRITRENQVRSIADFIAFRYGNSTGLGALVAVMMIVGMAPYIGLQLKAIDSSLEQIALPLIGGSFDFGLIIAVIIGIFGMFFSTSIIGSADRHEGMVAVIALESVIKLVALIAVGVFVTWSVFDGFSDIFHRIGRSQEFSHLLTLKAPSSDAPSWPALLMLSSLAIMLLPRQFHMMVVENSSEKHIADAMWGFPLYLFLINLFIIPIAFGGLLVFNGAERADSFVLTLPLHLGGKWLTLLAFIGGLSAATGMIIVSSTALSTMFINNLCMPFLIRLKLTHTAFPTVVVWVRRLAVLGICLGGYSYHVSLGESVALVNMGLISFGAAAQLAPALFGGLFWRQATAKGAYASLSMGFFCWIYLFLIPALCGASVLPPEWLTEGPLGLGFLRPGAFMGLTGLDMWSHGLFWSIFLNGGAYLVVSSMTRPGRSEIEQVARLTYSERGEAASKGDVHIATPPTAGEFEELVAKFLGPQKARKAMREFFTSRYDPAEKLEERDALRLRRHAEKLIGGVIGPTAASEVVDRYLTLVGSRMEEIFDVFGSISLSLEHSREELENRLRELAVLFEASKLVTATLDEKKAVNEVTMLLENDFGLANLGVFIRDGERLQAVKISGIHQRLVERLEGDPPGNSLVVKAMAEGRSVRGSVEEGDTSLELLPRFGLMTAAAIPMMKEEEVLGVLFVARRGSDAALSSKFIQTLEALASELALAIANARLFGEVTVLNRTLEEKVKKRTAELEAAMENLQQLDRMKSEFLANMSHELRTPMNSIIGYTNLVLDEVDGPVNEDQRKSLERVEANARHLLGIINDLLDLSRIEAGKLKLDLKMVDMGETAMEVAADLDSTAVPKGLDLVCEVAPDDLAVQADEVRLREVLINLVGNAIKFTEKGQVAVAVRAENASGTEGVRVDIKDSGPGIPVEQQENIFQAFKQLDGSSTRKHGGAGLGLSIAKKLVEMHGGTLTVTSSLGQGSNFTVWWPKQANLSESGGINGEENPGG